WRPRAAIILSCAILLGGVLLRAVLASQNATDTGVSFRGFQVWIYYPTWTRLDPLVFGVMIAAIEKFRPRLWQRLIQFGDLALAACSRADRLCAMAGRRRLHQLHCLRLAVSPACDRHGRAADLRASARACHHVALRFPAQRSSPALRTVRIWYKNS